MALEWFGGYIEYRDPHGKVVRRLDLTLDQAIEATKSLPEGTSIMYFPYPLQWKPEDYK